MINRIIALSGPVSCGKSALAKTLVDRFGFQVFRTRDVIKEMRESDGGRQNLQKGGEDLDKSTKGEWVRDALLRRIDSFPEGANVIVDAVRLESQVKGLRDGFGQARVVHVHLTAPLEVLAERYEQREAPGTVSYSDVRSDPTEAQVDSLKDIADIVIDTHRTTPRDVLARVAGLLGLYGRSLDRLVDVLIGGQYGSEGKGQVAAHLAPEYDVLVRVGGPNAGHKVFEEPQPYTFHLLPSGTRRCNATLVLGPGAVLNLDQLMKEIADCEVDVDRLHIDPQAVLIEQSDIDFEAEISRTIGGTKQGVGSATARKILRTAANPPVRLARDEKLLEPFIRDTVEVLEDAYSARKKILLEGTQGTGLSLHHGSYPYVTSRDTCVGGCLAEAGIAPSRVRKIVMVCRTFPIRVQSPNEASSGPMSREISLDEVSRRSGIPVEQLQSTETTSTTKRRRRIGEFDWALLRKATLLNGPTDIALTFADYITRENQNARRFDQLSRETIMLIEEIERVSCAPVSLIATRFDYRSVIDRRSW